MTSIGETLRAERKKRNLELDQISRELKISSRFLDAIETEQFGKLPGGVFAKSFVRQYARLLGLDEEELAAQMQRVLEPPAVPEHTGTKVSESDFHVPKMEEWESVGENHFRWSGSLSAAAIFVVALLICSGVYTWMQRQHTVEPANTGTAQPDTAQTATKPAEAPSPQPVSPVAAPPATQTATAPPSENPADRPAPEPPIPQAPAPRVAQGDPNAAVRVEVTAAEPVWVMARADGKVLFSGTIEANQSRTVEATESVLLRLGNAGGVNITLNGKPIGQVGPKGQVRTIQLTSGGFQIVSAKVPVALDPL